MIGAFVSPPRIKELIKLIKTNHAAFDMQNIPSVFGQLSNLQDFLFNLKALQSKTLLCGHLLAHLSENHIQREYIHLLNIESSNFFTDILHESFKQDDMSLNIFLFYLYRNFMRRPFANNIFAQKFTHAYRRADRVFLRVFPKFEEQNQLYKALKPILAKHSELRIEYFQDSSSTLDILKPLFYLARANKVFPVLYLKSRQIYTNENCHLAFIDLLYHYRVYKDVFVVTDLQKLENETEEFLKLLGSE